MHSKYYHATTLRPKTWFVIGSLRNEENIVFARTIDAKKSIIELFVPEDGETHFLKVMNYLKKHGYVLHFEEKQNRLMA